VKIFRSVGGQLFAALLVVVLIALGATYVAVIPILQRQLVTDRLDQLERSTLTITRGAAEVNPALLQMYAINTASAAGARVVVFQTFGPPLQLVVLADSLNARSAAIAFDRLALEAATSGEIVRGTVVRGGVRRAEVAKPIPGTSEIVLLSSPLSDAQRSVSTVKRQLLIAFIPSLLIALALGFFGARVLARRIRRLERAADRIADGRFEEPVEDEGNDEIAQLARSFERMRLRLAQLEEARREFIANASHELRTPIFALSGFLELIAEENMSKKSRREFVETMREQVERLKRLATALLDLSRLDAGKLDLKPQPVALASVAEDLRDEFEAAAEVSGHPLSVAASSTPIVLADEQRTCQIVRILLENALVHTPRNAKVVLRVAEKDGHGMLIVEDSGPGIPAAYRERVFERFYRLEGERSSGSGLGLAIAREWALRMGGEVSLESRPGKTRFTLTLPVANEEYATD
jgi:signal transduction histidine kinase